jgi:hypothetical protein
VCNIPNSSASEYLTTDISNSGVGKHYVGMKMNKFELSFLFLTLASVNKQLKPIYFFLHNRIFFIFM